MNIGLNIGKETQSTIKRFFSYTFRTVIAHNQILMYVSS